MSNKNIRNLNNLNTLNVRKEFSKPMLFNFMLKVKAFHFVENTFNIWVGHTTKLCVNLIETFSFCYITHRRASRIFAGQGPNFRKRANQHKTNKKQI